MGMLGQQPALKRLFNAFFFSWAGLKATFKTEQAFRQEVYLFIFLAPLGLYLADTAVEKILLVGSLIFVLIVELLNTAIERVVDRISLDHHALSKDAKDMGSAAVLFSLFIVVLTWGFVLFG